MQKDDYIRVLSENDYIKVLSEYIVNYSNCICIGMTMSYWQITTLTVISTRGFQCKCNYIYTKALCNGLDIPETVTQRKKRRNMEDFVVEASCGARSH